MLFFCLFDYITIYSLKIDKTTTNFALGIMLRRLISLVDIDFKSARLRSQCLRLRTNRQNKRLLSLYM